MMLTVAILTWRQTTHGFLHRRAAGPLQGPHHPSRKAPDIRSDF
jgi:hypothetical protein